MCKRIVFFTGRTQISDCSKIAEILYKKKNIRSTLITLGNYNKRKGEKEESFDKVKNILPEIEHDVTAQRAKKDNELLNRISSLVGPQFLGRAIASDRYIGAMRPTGTWHKDHPLCWGIKRINAFIARTSTRIFNYLRRSKPNGVFVESSSALYCITREMCKNLGINSFFISSPRVWDNRIYPETENDFLWLKCREKYNSLKSSGVDKRLQKICEKRLVQFRQNKSQPDYHANETSITTSIFQNLKINELTRYAKLWVRFIKEPWHQNPRSYVSKFLSPLGLIRRYTQRRESKKVYNKALKTKPDLQRPYVVYFLHVQPEATVDFMAQKYMEQVSTIRNISASLPPGVPLYVKEHNPMVGRRKSEFYARIFHIPNTILVDHEIHSHRYIKSSEAVVTLTGTPGLEAILYGIPSVVLGNIFYSEFDGVYHAQSWDDLRSILSNIPDGLNGSTTDDAIRTLAATYSASSPGVWPPDNENSPELTKQTARVFDLMLN